MISCVVTRDERPHLRRGVHGGACPGDACEGCVPVPAAPRLSVCEDHVTEVRKALRSLPELWSALADPRTPAPGSGAVDDDESDAYPPVLAASTLIRSTLVTWCKVLADHHQVPLPSEAAIVAGTRAEILAAQRLTDLYLDAWRDPLTDHARRPGLQLEIAAHRSRVARLRTEHETGADVIEALREHLDRHLSTLLAGGWVAGYSGCTEAQTFAEDVLDVAERARRAAYPPVAVIRIGCACGARVALDVDPDRVYVCPGCGTGATLDGWRRLEAPDAAVPTPLTKLSIWLVDHCGLEVTTKMLRHLRDRKAILPLPCECGLTRRQYGPHLAGCRASATSPDLFDPAAVLLVVQARASTWGRR